MADDSNMRCRFRWIIHNPFVPWKKCDIYFQNRSILEMEKEIDPWKVTIMPTEHQRFINIWKFVLRLRENDFRSIWDPPDKRLTGIFIQILYNFKLIHQYEYNANFLPETMVHAQPRSHDVLTVLITFRLPSEVQRNLTCIQDHVFDITRLSFDMNRVFIKSNYTNMSLKSNDNVEFGVHSYIIRARWSNLFREHNISPQQPAVRINTNHIVLQDILIYIYSGIIKGGSAEWGDISYVNELISVVKRYDLHHLHNVLLHDYNEHEQESERCCYTKSNSFNLKRLLDFYSVYGNGCAIRMPGNLESYNFSFDIYVQDENGLWFSYKLKSLCDRILFFQVNIELLKEVKCGTKDVYNTVRVWTLHQRNYNLNPKEVIQSEKILFLACPQTFGHLYAVDHNGRQRDVQYEIHCILRYTSGSEVNVSNRFYDSLISYEERCNILSHDMQKLVRDEFQEADLKIKAPQGKIIYTTYKAIFDVRVSEWQSVITPVDIVRQTPVLPNAGTLSLSNEAIPCVLRYICTGATVIPDNLLDEVEDFAIRGGCPGLQYFVYRSRCSSAISFANV